MCGSVLCSVRVVAAVHHLPHLLLLLLVHVVGQLRLLVPRGRHPLVNIGAGNWRRIWWVETSLEIRDISLEILVPLQAIIIRKKKEKEKKKEKSHVPAKIQVNWQFPKNKNLNIFFLIWLSGLRLHSRNLNLPKSLLKILDNTFHSIQTVFSYFREKMKPKFMLQLCWVGSSGAKLKFRFYSS